MFQRWLRYYNNRDLGPFGLVDFCFLSFLLKEQNMKFILTRTGFALLALGLFAGATQAQDVRGRAIHSGTIVGVGSRLCMELVQPSRQEGVRIQTGECRDARGEWDVTDLGNNEVAIVSRATGLVLDVAQASRDDGATVQQWTWNQSVAQRWRLEAKGANSYQVVNVGSGKCLDVVARSTSPGAPIAQYRCTGADNQQFRLSRVGQGGGPDGRPGVAVVPPAVVAVAPNNAPGVRPPGRSLYTGMIHSRATDKCVDVERASLADGANIFQWSCNATAAQIWDVVDLGRNEVAFVAQASNKVMDVQGGDRRSGADVRQYSWNGAPSQRWRMENAERGFSTLVNVGSGKCLDLDGAARKDGAEIMQFDCHGGVNQQWRIEVSGNDAGWRGYNSGRNWRGGRDQSYSEEPPAFLVGDFNAFNNYYQANIKLSIHSDGVVFAAIEGGQRVTGYYRGSQLFLGNARFDIQQEPKGFRTVQVGQPANSISYVRSRYESPRGVNR
jgi:hypothetical protein